MKNSGFIVVAFDPIEDGKVEHHRQWKLPKASVDYALTSSSGTQLTIASAASNAEPKAAAAPLRHAGT